MKAKKESTDPKISGSNPTPNPFATTSQQDGIRLTDITQEMQKSYLDYAMSVIVSRALPDVKDGLKPVQRRIIYAMKQENMTHNGKFHKCASVVGEVMKNFHPHGDSSVYEALVRMGQDFTLRYPLIWPQGNFGSVDGDPAAAMRYTECKLQKITETLYADIDYETVDFVLNDLQNEEPIYLPSALPTILLNGSSGIAVGMATNIPPHNLAEVMDGLLLLIATPETLGQGADKDLKVKIADDYSVSVVTPNFSSTSTVEDLIKVIKGPDFPTGGIIYDQKELIQMYATGKGRVVTRAKMDIEEVKGGKTRIIVTEIPYQINKSTLISHIADLVRDKKLEGISDLRDESNREGMRIMIELKKDAIAKKVQNQLYKHSQLQSTFNANMVALIDGEPKLLSLKRILEEFIKHRQKVVVKRTIYFLKKIKAREHILQGLKKALDHIDEIIKLIRASKDADIAKTELIRRFDFSELQAQAILDMQLRKLAALERQKIEDELNQILKTIKEYEALLGSLAKILETVKAEFVQIKATYGDDRKTKVIKSKVGELTDEDLVVDERCLITISENGYIKRLKDANYRKQGRGGKGVQGQGLKEEDLVIKVKACATHDYALFFTDKGKVYKLRIWEIPETSKNSKGTALVNFLSIKQDEKVEEFLTLPADQLESDKGSIFFGTVAGTVKKTSISDFANIRTSGIIAINLDESDRLGWVKFTTGKDDVILTTHNGMSIRFSETDVRPMGRTAGGVKGISLKSGDFVVDMVVLSGSDKKSNLLVVSERGMGKKTPVSEYKTQGRGGSGILTYKVTDKTGKLISARLLNDELEGDVLIASSDGMFLRLEKTGIPELGRSTQGVKLIRLHDQDKVISVAILDEAITDENVAATE